MKKALLVVVLLLAAYLAGYWPQHRQLQTAQESMERFQTVAVFNRIENQLLGVIDDTENKNYGNAQNGSGPFFDGVRAEIDRSPTATYRQGLEAILARRDAIVAGLSRADSSTVLVLRQSLNEVRQIVQKLPS